MTDDPNRKTLRQFQCRDYLWDTFEQMSQELECSVDYLVNEAMRHYARSQGKLRQTVAPGTRTTGGAPNAMPGGAPMRPPPNTPPVMRAPVPPQAMGVQGRPMMQQQPPPGYAQPRQAPPMPNAGGYPPRMPAQPPAYPSGNGAVLYALYEGQKYPIVKDEFYIGRSNKSCDLIVKDPNVSRQHARIVRHQGQYWMVDMGSTNGIEFQGTRVDRKPIGEGDSFRICDHEIVFTYR